jgi:anti-anti-sigma factor
VPERFSISHSPLSGVDNGVCVAPCGPLRARQGEQFREQLDELLETLPTVLVLDLEGCDTIDSSACGYLLMVHDKLKARGGSLALASLTPGVQVVIDSIGLSRFFTVCDSVDDAVHRLRDA